MSEIIINSPPMYGKFHVYKEGHKDLDSSIYVVTTVNEDFKCSIKIPPHNKLFGKVDVEPKPRIIENLIPIKDVHVNEETPSFSIGQAQVLYVGNDKGYRYRAFIGFDLNALPKEMLIIDSKLTLYFANDIPFEGLELWELNRDWHESSTTWFYQPTGREIINVKNIDKNITSITFDVKEVVNRWYSGEKENFGFLLKAYDEYLDQLKGIYSRESFYPPELKITYIDPHVTNPRRTLFNGYIKIRRSDESLISGSIEIPTYERENYLGASIDVWNHLMLQTSIFINKNTLNSSIIIKRTDEDDFDSSLIVIKHDLNEINSNIFINRPFINSNIFIKKVSNLNSEISIERNRLQTSIIIKKVSNLNSSIIVRKTIENEYLNSSITVTRKNMQSNIIIPSYGKMFGKYKIIIPWDDFESNIYINKPFINSSVYIIAQSSINGLIFIERKNLTSSIYIRPVQQLNANITIYKPEEEWFNSNIYINKPFLNSSINIKPTSNLNSSIHIERNRLSSSLFVKKKTDLKSSIHIKQHYNINSSINIRLTNNLESSIHIERNRLNSKIIIRPTSNLESNIHVKRHDSISGSIYINQLNFASSIEVRWHNSLDSEIIIRPTSNLESSLKIMNINNFDADITVKQRWFSDMGSSIEIKGSTKRYAYVFIM